MNVYSCNSSDILNKERVVLVRVEQIRRWEHSEKSAVGLELKCSIDGAYNSSRPMGDGIKGAGGACG